MNSRLPGTTGVVAPPVDGGKYTPATIESKRIFWVDEMIEIFLVVYKLNPGSPG